MPTSNEQILDRYIRHQTYLLRYAGGLRNQVLPELVNTEKKLYDSIVEWVAKAEGNRTLTGTSGRKWQQDFEKVLNNVRQPAWDDVSQEISNQLKELSVSEAATGATIIESSLPVVIGMNLPPASKLVSIVNSQPFEGRTLKEWMGRTAQADVQKMLTYAKIGIVQGQTPTQVARGIIGTKAARYTDGIARKSFKDIESVILTLTNGIQQEAKQALYEANSDIIDKELYVATLDVRTTIECASYDGKTFNRGEGPIPPLHFRCRSLRVPYINSESLGNRGFDESTEKQLLQEYSEQAKLPKVNKRSELPYGYKTKFDKFARKRRRDLVGQVPAQTNYNDWLKKQSKEFQDQVLGPTRADMFRKGEVTLDKFVARDGDVLTLDELRKKGLEVPGISSSVIPTTKVDPRIITSKKEADAFYSYQTKPSSDDIRKDVRKYTQGYHSEINAYRRTGKSRDPKTSLTYADVTKVDSGVTNYIRSQTLANDTELYRALRLPDDFSWETGSVFADPGIISTNGFLDEKIKKRFSQYVPQGQRAWFLKIQVPKGVNAAYVRPYSAYKSEAEVLLDGGSFRVDRIDGNEITVTYIGEANEFN
jgi:DNA-binding Lrp family transcriptional regulator